jgi:hypothetical protein
MIASENALNSAIGILSSFFVFFDYNTLTAFPMNNIFSAKDGGKYEDGNIEILRVYTEFHSSSLESSSAPKFSGSIVNIDPTKFKFDIDTIEFYV